MSFPSASQTLSRPSERPETTSQVIGRTRTAFRLRFDPRQVDFYDLTGVSKAALGKAGLEERVYWLPRPYEMPAQPGVNGVWNDVSAGWKTEDILAKGYPELTSEERAAGLVLLDAWEQIPAEFCPPGAEPGPVLRYTAVRGGRHYHTVWGGLNVVDAREDAREGHDRALQAAWVAWCVKSGRLPAASETQVKSAINDAEKRVASLSVIPNVTKDSHVLIQAEKRLESLKNAIRVTRG